MAGRVISIDAVTKAPIRTASPIVRIFLAPPSLVAAGTRRNYRRQPEKGHAFITYYDSTGRPTGFDGIQITK